MGLLKPLIAGQLAGAALEMRLFVNEPDFETGVTLADLIEPQFLGYRRMSGPIWRKLEAVSEGYFQAISHLLIYKSKGGPAGEFVRGYHVVLRSAVDSLVGWKVFDTPVPTKLPGARLSFIAALYELVRPVS